MGTMPEWQRRILRDNRETLTKNLDVKFISNYLIQEGVLTPEMWEEVKSKPTRIESTEALLDMLPSRGDKALK